MGCLKLTYEASESTFKVVYGELYEGEKSVQRWWSPDPIVQPWQSNYSAMDGNPIYFTDILGLEAGGGGGGNTKTVKSKHGHANGGGRKPPGTNLQAKGKPRISANPGVTMASMVSAMGKAAVSAGKAANEYIVQPTIKSAKAAINLGSGFGTGLTNAATVYIPQTFGFKGGEEIPLYTTDGTYDVDSYEATSTIYDAAATTGENIVISGVGGGIGVIVKAGAAPLLKVAKATMVKKVAKVVAESSISPDRLHHIFGKSEHALESLINKFGSQEAAFNAVQKAANQALSAGKLTPNAKGILPSGDLGNIINVGGSQVRLIGGRVENNQVIISSFSRKGF